jgi:DNA-binding NtrC family response regulator
MAKTVLIVDDDPAQRRLMQAVVERQGFRALQAEGGEQALEIIDGNNPHGVAVVMLDLVMPGLSGMETLELLSKRKPDLPVIVLTAQAGIDVAVKAMQAGAVDFFVKPAAPERIMSGLRNALKLSELSTEVTRLKAERSGELGFDKMVASAPAMQQVVRLGQRAAASNIPILITGESGVGKELIARAIQGASERRGKPFITVNCGAIPENLIESILFGHEKGAFTGADRKHDGKFKEADGGTLFLDEVGELPLDAQVKLLRVLQEGEVDAVGSKKPTKVDVRIISATNRDMAEQVKDGAFREDLFYRLNVFPIEAPPLRNRKEDIPSMVGHFIQRFNAQEGRSVTGASRETMDLLLAQDWPGNVRQLENAVFRAVILCEGSELGPEDFPQLSGMTPSIARAPVQAPVLAEAVRVAPGEGETAPAATSAEAASAARAAAQGELSPVPIVDENGHLRPLEAIERDLIQYAIETYAGRMAEVARRLGIGRSTLYRKVREHDLEVDSLRDAG